MPSRAFSTTVRGSASRVDPRGRLNASSHVSRRAPSRRGCMPRPGLRRLGSRTQDPSMRRVDRTPCITVRRRPCSRSASRALPCAGRLLRPRPCGAFVGERSVLPVPPLRRHPTPPSPRRSSPPEGAPRAGPRRRSYVEPSTAPAPHEARRHPRPSRSAGSSPVARWTATVLTRASSTATDLRLASAGRWWAPLSPGGPTLLDFRTSSTRLERSSYLRRSAYTPFGPRPYWRFTSGETPRRRDAGSHPLDAVRSLSRAR